MLFSSPDFLFAFLPAFFTLYFLCPTRGRNAGLFLASLFFYFSTSGELTVVLVLSVLFNYWLGLRLAKDPGIFRETWLVFGVVVNLAPLIYYKYAVFLLASAADALALLGIPVRLPGLSPILPIGISFFTFQAISYVADVYLGRVRPCAKLTDFGMYHTCFPQLIAGPIVRYEEVESRIINRQNSLEDAYQGVVQFCFGLAKKVVLADTLGTVADRVFNHAPASLGLAAAWTGLASYTLQIYFDFSGYSDMAIGLGRILGFNYPENFDQPYRSRSVTEFWRRWHMTLSRWFRDYVYIGLGGNRQGMARTLCNLLAVFFLCGLWHGAAYTFVVWGLYHGLLLILERAGKRWLPLAVPAPLGWAYTLAAVMLGWVFFRSASLPAAAGYLKALGGFGAAQPAPSLAGSLLTPDKAFYLVLGALVALVPYHWFARFEGRRYTFHPALGLLSVLLALLGIVMMSVNGFSPFIYFRF